MLEAGVGSTQRSGATGQTDQSLGNFRTLFPRYGSPSSGNPSSLSLPLLGWAREIFIRKDSLTHFLFSLLQAASNPKNGQTSKYM